MSKKQFPSRIRNQPAIQNDETNEAVVAPQVVIQAKKVYDKSKLEIIFEGLKVLWKLRTSIDVCFILHKYTPFHVIEICAFYPTSKESSRIYISVPLLESKLDDNLIQARTIAMQESLVRQKKPVHFDEIRMEIKVSLMVDFLLARLDSPASNQTWYGSESLEYFL